MHKASLGLNKGHSVRVEVPKLRNQENLSRTLMKLGRKFEIFEISLLFFFANSRLARRLCSMTLRGPLDRKMRHLGDAFACGKVSLVPEQASNG